MSFVFASIFAALLVVAVSVRPTTALSCYLTHGSPTASEVSQADCATVDDSSMDKCITTTYAGYTIYGCASQKVCETTLPPASGATVSCCNTNLCNNPAGPQPPAPTGSGAHAASGNNGAASRAAESVLALSAAAWVLKTLMQ